MAQPSEARCVCLEDQPAPPSPPTHLLTLPVSLLTACNKGPWTEEEDQIILERVQQHGTKWAKISGLYLPDRPENDIKNRWHIPDTAAPALAEWASRAHLDPAAACARGGRPPADIRRPRQPECDGRGGRGGGEHGGMMMQHRNERRWRPYKGAARPLLLRREDGRQDEHFLVLQSGLESFL